MSKVEFLTNSPQEVCLMSLDGEAADSKFGGPQRKFTTTERDVFYVSEAVGNIIADTCRKLRIEEREPVVICKAEVPDTKGRKQIRWQVTRVNAPPPRDGPQPDGGFAVPIDARGVPPAGSGKISIHTNGANVSPSAPPATPTTQVQQPMPSSTGNGTTANGRAAAPLPAGRPKTKLEDALKTVAAALLDAERYAKEIGYEAWPKQFTGDEVVRMAATLLINGSRENCNGGPR